MGVTSAQLPVARRIEGAAGGPVVDRAESDEASGWCGARGRSAPLDGQLDGIARRLRAAHPLLAPADVDAVVMATARRFADARVQELLPILVERAARDALDGRRR